MGARVARAGTRPTAIPDPACIVLVAVSCVEESHRFPEPYAAGTSAAVVAIHLPTTGAICADAPTRYVWISPAPNDSFTTWFGTSEENTESGVFPGSSARNEIPYGFTEGSPLHTCPRFVCRPPCEYPASAIRRRSMWKSGCAGEVRPPIPSAHAVTSKRSRISAGPATDVWPPEFTMTPRGIHQHHVPVLREIACVRRVVAVVLGRAAAVEDLEQREPARRHLPVRHVHVRVELHRRAQRVRRRHRNAVRAHRHRGRRGGTEREEHSRNRGGDETQMHRPSPGSD